MFVRLCLYQNHYRLLVVDLRRQKEVDADFKTIQQIINLSCLNNFRKN